MNKKSQYWTLFAGMLMSLAGQLKFCQVVDPLKTVRFEFPKSILAEYGYYLP